MSDEVFAFLLLYFVWNTVWFFIYAIDGNELKFSGLLDNNDTIFTLFILIVFMFGFWITPFVINELIIAINKRIHRTENNDIEVNNWLTDFIKED